MKELTREELARGRALIEAAFDGPWRYTQFEIECSTCEGGTTSVCDGKEFVSCTNPECDGSHTPCTFVEAPKAYPGESGEYHAQVVATIDVPGLSTLAEKNGEAICWLRNEGAALIEAHEMLLDLRSAIEFIADREEHAPGSGPAVRKVEDLVGYAKSLGWTGGTP